MQPRLLQAGLPRNKSAVEIGLVRDEWSQGAQDALELWELGSEGRRSEGGLRVKNAECGAKRNQSRAARRRPYPQHARTIV